MATYDKYEPIAGGFRARLAAAPSALTDGGIGPVAVSLNTSGRVVLDGTGGTGIIGILVKNVARGPIGAWGTQLHGGTPNPNAPIGLRAGDAVDIMTNGEIVDLDPAVFTAGTKFYAVPATGALTDDATAGNVPVGFTVEAGRLVVRFGFGTTAVPTP